MCVSLLLVGVEAAVTGILQRQLEDVRVLVFDLDGTLLGLDIKAFAPVYRRALSRRLREVLGTGEAVVEQAVAHAELAMMRNRGGPRSNQEVFMSTLESLLGAPREALEVGLQVFYREDFPALSYLSRTVPEARSVLERALKVGYRLVLATNPIFPQVGIRERMRWAQIDDFPFELVTTYETMHACKPHEEYYREVVDIVGAKPSECLMVGNDAEADMSASAAGMRTYLVEGPYLIDKGSRLYRPDFRGTLASLGKML